MAWYEAHQTLAKHPKTLRLASLLKCERRYAVGLLHDLFSWGLDAAKKDGSLPGLSAEEIAIALDFTGKKGTDAVSALLKSGYLETVDETFKIHDWYEYAGKFADQREDAKKRKDAWKERKLNGSGTRTEQFQNSSRTVLERGKNAPTVPNLTVPNNTTTSTEKIDSHAQDEQPQNDLARVMTFFMDRINPTPSGMCVEMLKSYTANLGADVVLHAFGIAIDEHKTGWSYIKAILSRYEREGLRTLEAVLQSEQRHDAGKEPQETPPKPKKQERPVDMDRDLVEYPEGSGFYRPYWEVPGYDGGN